MTTFLVVLYVLIGLGTAGFATWESAKDEAKMRAPSPLFPLAMGAIAGLLWPLALLLITLASAGMYLIEKAGGNRG